MTPQEFTDAMRYIIEANHRDTEALHSEIDALWARLLIDLGYDEGVAMRDGLSLWFA